MIALRDASTAQSDSKRLLPAREDLTSDPPPDLVHCWRQFVEGHSRSPVDLHPGVVEAMGRGHGQASVHIWTRRGGCDLDGLAVLMEKRLRPPSFRRLSWAPALRGLRLVGGQVLGVDDEPSLQGFLGRLETLMHSSSPQFDCVLFEDLETDSPLWRVLNRQRQSRLSRVYPLGETQTHWKLRFPDSPTEYWQQFSSKTRYNFRRAKRLLDHSWQVVQDEEDVEGFLCQAAEVSARSWQAKRIGIRIRNSEQESHLYRTLARLGALRSYLLHREGEPIAFAIGTQWNQRFVLEEIGYDTKYAKQSPGTVLMQCMLEDMLEQDTPKWMDFGFGDGDYKRLFGNCSTESGSLLLVSRRLWPTLATGVDRWCGSVKEKTRACLNAGGIGKRLRQLYRR